MTGPDASMMPRTVGHLPWNEHQQRPTMPASLGKGHLQELLQRAQDMVAQGVESVETYRLISSAATSRLQESTAELRTSAECLLPAAQLLRLLTAAGLTSPGLVNALATSALQHALSPLPAPVLAPCIAALCLSPQDGQVSAAVKGLASSACSRFVELTLEDRGLISWSLVLQGYYESFLDLALGQTHWSAWATQPPQDTSSALALFPDAVSGSSQKLATLTQVFLADLALTMDSKGRRTGLGPQRAFIKDALKRAQAQSSESASPEVRTIVEALKSMDLYGALGCRTAEGIPLGIRISTRDTSSSKLSIEVDGPEDFIVNTSTGRARHFMPTAFRRMLLRRLGHTVAVIPFYEIRGCSQQQVVELLRAKLAALATPSPNSASKLTAQRAWQPNIPETAGNSLLADTGGTLAERTSCASTATDIVADGTSSSYSEYDGVEGVESSASSPWLRPLMRAPPGLSKLT
eukprot:TRINITY_DN98366_c0_g1_i1.p1 TRINITY_DN98366_c0_g1~~TRINITY_DN98366_c0_g1_i1.p1  ORF type:complete len:465 (-),score=90.35 TRINITY_DN98366_c0_g1_i1:58-1452(-)